MTLINYCQLSIGRIQTLFLWNLKWLKFQILTGSSYKEWYTDSIAVKMRSDDPKIAEKIEFEFLKL